MRGEPQDHPHWTEQRVTIAFLVVAVGLASLELFSGMYFLQFRIQAGVIRTEPWRFFTAALLHGGVLHLGMNMMAVSFLGARLEPILGTWRTLLAYVGIGAGSMAAEYALWGANPVGLSGIAYGQGGLLWALARWHPNMRRVFDDRLAQLLVVWFFICCGLTYLDILNVANVAHLVGGLLGVLFGWGLAQPRSLRRALEWLAPTTCVVIVLVAMFARRWVNLSGAVQDDGLGQVAIDAFGDEDPERARELLLKALELDPDDAINWYNLGIAHSRLKEPEFALPAFERSLELRPGNQRTEAAVEATRIELGNMALVQAESERALALAEDILASNPESAEGYAIRGLALADLGRDDEAIESLEFALNLGTDHPSVEFVLDQLTAAGR